MKNQNQLITSFYKGKGKKGFLRPLALSFFMLASIDASAQVGKVSLDINNVSVKEFFSAIEKQTSYHFSYRDIEIQDKEAVTVSSKDEEIKTAHGSAVCCSLYIGLSAKDHMPIAHQYMQ